jgi:hypothetical protein
VVRNLSDGGAALEVPSAFSLPAEFRLMFDDDASPRKCKVVWKKTDQSRRKIPLALLDWERATMADEFSHESQAKRLFGLGEMEQEALEVLRLLVRQTKCGENLDAELVKRAKAIVDRYDNAIM